MDIRLTCLTCNIKFTMDLHDMQLISEQGLVYCPAGHGGKPDLNLKAPMGCTPNVTDEKILPVIHVGDPNRLIADAKPVPEGTGVTYSSIDKTSPNNIKCEHCRLWHGKGRREPGRCRHPRYPMGGRTRMYYQRCANFKWR